MRYKLFFACHSPLTVRLAIIILALAVTILLEPNSMGTNSLKSDMKEGVPLSGYFASFALEKDKS